MSAYNFDTLKSHVGHRIACVEYRLADEGGEVYDVSVECEDCNEVLVSYSADDEADELL